MPRSPRVPLSSAQSAAKALRQLTKLPARLMQAGDFIAATAAIQRALSSGWGLPTTSPARATRSAPLMAAATPPPRAKGAPVGSFIPGYFVHAASRLDYKLFIPPSSGTSPLPLVVMLHGCSQDPDDFAAGTAMNQLASTLGFFVLYPEQTRHANSHGCWNWFKHNHQKAERGEPALIAGATRAIMNYYNVDPDRVFVAGLSAGGAMAAILGCTHPELYSAVGVHSGLAAGSADDLPSALLAMSSGAPGPIAPSPTPTIVFHGAEDRTVHPSNGVQVARASAGHGSTVHSALLPYPQGQSVTHSTHRAPNGRVTAELWACSGSGHAWSGGDPAGSHADAHGPNASAEMIRFFLEHPRQRT